MNNHDINSKLFGYLTNVIHGLPSNAESLDIHFQIDCAPRVTVTFPMVPELFGNGDPDWDGVEKFYLVAMEKDDAHSS